LDLAESMPTEAYTLSLHDALPIFRLGATDCEHWHRQRPLGELREVLRRLRERHEVRPARTHPSWPGVRRRVGGSIGVGDGPCLVGGKIIPEVLEVRALASTDQRFGRRPVEAEMPDTRVVVHALPSAHAW